MLDAGCRMLDTRLWMLDTGCWILDAGFWMLDSGCGVGVRVARYELRDAGCAMKDPAPGIRHTAHGKGYRV